jgi:hypothetical protein
VKIESNLTLDNNRLIIFGENYRTKSESYFNSNYESLYPSILGDIPKIEFKLEQPPIFVLGTGRSGTNSIVNILNQNKEVIAYHEPCDEFIPTSANYEHNKIDFSYVEFILKTVLFKLFDSKKINVVSDPKLGNLIPVLNKIFPEAKFIWLIREPKEFINSAYHRGWFANEEFDFEKETNAQEVYSSKIFSRYRIDGSQLGIFSREEWFRMGSFNRNVWFWKYWNSKIEMNLTKLDRSRFLALGLNNLNSRLNVLSNFIGTESFHYQGIVTNKAKYKKGTVTNWSKEWEDSFNKYCFDYYNNLKDSYDL